jgi:capsular exopolysaccharide synthesis family protein
MGRIRAVKRAEERHHVGQAASAGIGGLNGDSFLAPSATLEAVEPEHSNGGNGDSSPAPSATLEAVEPEHSNGGNGDSSPAVSATLEAVEPEHTNGGSGDSSLAASATREPIEPEHSNGGNGDSSPAASATLEAVKPEHANGGNGNSSVATSGTSGPVFGAPYASSRSFFKAVRKPHWELPAPAERLEPSRDSKSLSPDGFRHLALLAGEESRLVFPTNPNGLAAEQFRLLRRTLIRESDTGAVLLITSPAAGDGKTFTSVNLASCLAESGSPTLLVEMDVRRPKIAEVLSRGIEPPGLEDALAGKVEPSRVVHGIRELNLYVAMVAKTPENPSRLVSGPGIKRFLAWAREHFLWVVLDAPPVIPVADVTELLPLADAALLIVRAQGTPRELAKRAVEMMGKHLRGVIFNEVTVESNPHYRYMREYDSPQKTYGKSG